MAPYPHALEQYNLVQRSITTVTVVTIEKEVVIGHVYLMVIGLSPQPVKEVCCCDNYYDNCRKNVSHTNSSNCMQLNPVSALLHPPMFLQAVMDLILLVLGAE